MAETTISTLPQVAKTIDEYPEISSFSDPGRVLFHARDETRDVGSRTVVVSLSSIAAQDPVYLSSIEEFVDETYRYWLGDRSDSGWQVNRETRVSPWSRTTSVGSGARPTTLLEIQALTFS